MIPFPAFEPDRSKYALAASTNIVNCIPIVDGWGPIPDLSVISTTLGAEVKGAFMARTTASPFSYRLFACTTTEVFEFNTSTLGWTSRGSGYALPDGDEWSGKQFGAYFYLSNIADGLIRIDVDLGTSFSAVSGAPKGKYLFIAGDYFCIAHIDGAASRFQTSGINDPTYWTVGQRGCDYQDLPAGEEITGAVGGPLGAVIYQRSAICQMTLSAGAYSFTVQTLNPSRGAIAPLSIAEIAPGRTFYYSADGFFIGAEGTPIGRERVDRWFDAEIDRNYLHEIKAMPDPFQKVVWVQAKRADGSRFLLGYHWGLDRWCYAENNLTGMAALVTPAVTIDGMDAYFATIDAADDVVIDSRLFTGGVPAMAVFDTSNRLCYMTGTPRAATLETADAALSGAVRSFLKEATVVTDCPTYTLRAITSDFAGGTRTVGSAVTPYSTTGICHFRSPAKYHAFRMEIPAGTEWTNVTGVEPQVKQEGRR